MSDATGRRRPGAELAGYVLLALGLGALLVHRTSQVDGFYLDEWFYVNGAEYIWEHLPGGLNATIPEWNRGPQRLYSTLLAPVWGPVGGTAAFKLGHLLNVALLLSAIVPAALIARRIVDEWWLRVLAVALAVALPWLTISAHLLTENLAFPVVLWVVYLAALAADEPSVRNHLLALAAVAAAVLTRLNLAPLIAALVLCVLVAEARRRRADRSEPLGAWARGALRRRWPVLLATVLGLAVAVKLLTGGSAGLGAYGGFSLDTIGDSLFGEKARNTRLTVMTYFRSLVLGTGVLPMVLGLAAGLAGACGRLGPRLVAPSVAALTTAAVILAGVSVWTAGAALEERYVFAAVPPLALLAVAGLRHLPRMAGWTAAGAGLCLWAVITGVHFAAFNSSHFFAGPAGAFWTRVVHHRLRALETDLLGWTLVGPTGWLLLLLALGLLVAAVAHLGARRPGVLRTGLTALLAGCVLYQAVALDYAYRQELFGTVDAPGGGIAHPGDRDDQDLDWIDDAVPDGTEVAVVLGVVGVDGPFAGVEKLSFWNRAPQATLAVGYNGAPVVSPPGFQSFPGNVGPAGLVEWSGPDFDYIVGAADDPRMQFAGEPVTRHRSGYQLLRARTPIERAIWTATEMDADAAVQRGRPAVFTLDRAGAPDVRRVVLTLDPAGARPVGFRLTSEGADAVRGVLRGDRPATVTLDVPPCGAGDCAPVSWRLTATGTPVDTPFPVFGAPPPPRPVLLYATAAKLLP